MMVRIEIKRNIYPRNYWHWSVIFDNGHTWDCESYTSLWRCMVGLIFKGLPSLKKAERVLDFTN